ncbi:MAG: aspartate dehydrogenase [Lachnospiraceae bacterium]|nr:aspartate dehydrogenase [Lachnospiraceae bacterium]
MMFGRKKKKIEKKSYDRENMKPILHASICTGETVAGFKNRRTGKFEEVMLVKSEADKELFKEIYDITDDLPTEY